MQKAFVGFGVVVLLLVVAPALAGSGDLIPDFTYYAGTGNMYVSTDLLGMGSYPADGLYGMNIIGPQAISVQPGRTPDWSTTISWQGGNWIQNYGDGMEQWMDFSGSNLKTSGADLLIATYATGLGNSSFSGQCVAYGGAINGSSSSTLYTNVTIMPAPEPSSMVLLGIALVGLLAYVWRKWKGFVQCRFSPCVV